MQSIRRKIASFSHDSYRTRQLFIKINQYRIKKILIINQYSFIFGSIGDVYNVNTKIKRQRTTRFMSEWSNTLRLSF